MHLQSAVQGALPDPRMHAADLGDGKSRVTVRLYFGERTVEGEDRGRSGRVDQPPVSE